MTETTAVYLSTDVTNSDEKELFLLIAEGNETAFRELYRLYGQLMLPFLTQLTGSADVADEIIQEVFLRVWLYRDQLPGIAHPRPWIFRIGANRAHTWLKKNLKAGQAARQYGYLQSAAANPVETQLAVKAIQTLVQQAVNELPARRKRIYLLQREQGMRPAEIAGLLGISVSTVKNTLLAAMQYIREKLEKAGYGICLLLLFLRK